MKLIRFFSIFILLLSVLLSSAEARNLYCTKCGKRIVSSYYRSKDGSALCPRDYEKSKPKCEICGRKISNNYFTDETGKVMCPSCVEAKKLRCERCKVKLTGEYFSRNNKNYCPSCNEAQTLRCERCKVKLTGKYFVRNNKNYCPSCKEATAPICECCEKRIKDRYRVNYDGAKICADCFSNKSFPRCVECDYPVDPKKSSPIPYFGDYVCKKHRSNSVVTVEQLKILLGIARNNLVNVFGPTMKNKSARLDVSLINRKDLIKLSNQRSEHVRGFCKSRKIGNIVTHKIYILAGMSRQQTLRTLYHELAHSWQFENNKNSARQLSDTFSEGFAEWIAYRTAEANGDKAILKNQLENKIQVYSQGLKKFLEFERIHGRKKVFDKAKNSTYI